MPTTGSARAPLVAVQDQPFATVGQSIGLSIADTGASWSCPAGARLNVTADRRSCSVTLLEPGAVHVSATTAGGTTTLTLAAISSDVGTNLAIPGSIDPAGYYKGALVFQAGVTIVRRPEDWTALWEKARAYTKQFVGLDSSEGVPVLTGVDFDSRMLVVDAASLYSGERAPRVVSFTQAQIDIVTPSLGQPISHLDFDQYLMVYSLPRLDAEVKINASSPPE